MPRIWPSFRQGFCPCRQSLKCKDAGLRQRSSLQRPSSEDLPDWSGFRSKSFAKADNSGHEKPGLEFEGAVQGQRVMQAARKSFTDYYRPIFASSIYGTATSCHPAYLGWVLVEKPSSLTGLTRTESKEASKAAMRPYDINLDQECLY